MHGLDRLKKAISVLGERAIDKRTAVGRAMEEWRHSLLVDLGGVDHASRQQRQLIDCAVKTKLILDSIDAWLVAQPAVVNKKKRVLFPVVLQRQTICDSLARLMTQLGLERRARPVPTLADYLAGKRENPTDPDQAQTPSETDGTASSLTTKTTVTT